MRRGVTLSMAIGALGAFATAASAAPPAALVTSTITLAATGTAVGSMLTAGTSSTAIQLAGKELASMSAASKATALMAGAVGTLTVGGALLFGGVLGDLSGPGGNGPEQGTEIALVSSEIAATDADEGTILLALGEAEEALTPATEEKEALEGSEDQPVVASEEEDATEKEAAPSQFGEAVKSEEMTAEDGSSGESAGPPLVASFRQLSAKDQKIYEALELEMPMELPDNTLVDVMEYIGERAGISVRLDTSALTDAGIDAEARIAFVGAYALGDSLPMLLENVNDTQLDYYIDRGVLHITTAEKMQGDRAMIRLRFYDLYNDEEGEQPGIKNLAVAVQNYIRELQNNGEATIISVTSLGDSLAIRASLGSHRDIEEFIAGAMKLAEARRVANRPLPVVPEPPKLPVDVPMKAAGGGGGYF